MALPYFVTMFAGNILYSVYQNKNHNILVAVLAIVVLIISCIIACLQSLRLAKVFGKGTGFGIGLFLLAPIFRIILGFGDAEYVGIPEKI